MSVPTFIHHNYGSDVKMMFVLKQDGNILSDTHMFLFSDIVTAILTLYLFSVTFSSKHIRLYFCGYMSCKGDILETRTVSEFVCDYYDAIDLFVKIKELYPEKYTSDYPINVEYLNNIKNDVDTVIRNKYALPNNNKE